LSHIGFFAARRQRIAAWLAAQVVFIYIVWVAITRNPSPWTV
jgi:cobalamin biosynthesis protein CobD/CbiB